MGNISSPVITRLGVNQFWYKHWFSDNNNFFKKNLQIDNLIENFIKCYLDYGFLLNRNIFISDYFFKKSISKKNFFINKNLKIIRRVFFINKSINFENSYTERVHSGEYFPMRIWILKYNTWLIVSVSWFKPIKGKTFFKKKNIKKNINNFYTEGFFKKNNNRMKIYFFLIYKNFFNKINSYNF